MADEQIQATITEEVVETNERAWIPPERRVEVVLQPVPGEEPYFPPSGPVPIEVAVPLEAPACLINIESTGLMPFSSRLLSIAAVDLRSPENVIDFTGRDEEKVLRDFLAWFSLGRFTEIFGYNISFDYRFIFAKAMKYGLSVPEIYNADLRDVMQMMQQVKEKFVFGFNRPGLLDEWTQYYFGITGILTYEQVLEAWERKDLKAIAEHNKQKVIQAVLLYALVLLGRGEAHV